MPPLKNSIANLRKFGLWFWKFIVGGAVVAVGFAANFVDLRQSALAVEITQIEQRTSADIDVKSSPDFAHLRDLMAGNMNFRLSSFRNTDAFKEIQNNIDQRDQELLDLQRVLSDFDAQVEKIPRDFKPETSESDRSTRTQILLYVQNDDSEFAKFKDQLVSNVSYDDAKKLAKSLRDRLDGKKILVKAARDELETYRAKTEKTEAKIVVTAAITNSGDGSTTLKPQALLRTDLGQGNYLDISLDISNYQGSEIKPRGASIVRFESPPISQMAPQDQKRFLDFFKNTSPTNLIVVDARNRYYRSNTIPFAQGIYEQKIFDGLKDFASRQPK